MAQIINRKFNPTQKIQRTIFRGSPNLFTTSDLNRQFESIQHHLMELSQRTPARFDLLLKAGVSSTTADNVTTDTFSVTLDMTNSGGDKNIYAYGIMMDCSSYDGATLTKSVTRGKNVYLIYVIESSHMVSYENDTTHEISGSVFSDGTSKPSADNYVYDDGVMKLVDLDELHYYIANFKLLVTLAEFSVDATSSTIVVNTHKFYRNGQQTPFAVESEGSGGISSGTGRVYSGKMGLSQDHVEGETISRQCGTWNLAIEGKIACLHAIMDSNMKLFIAPDFDIALYDFPKIQSLIAGRMPLSFHSEVDVTYKKSESSTSSDTEREDFSDRNSFFWPRYKLTDSSWYMPFIYSGSFILMNTKYPVITDVKGRITFSTCFIIK